MNIKDFSRYGCDVLSLIKLSKIKDKDLLEALENPYKSYYLYKKGKKPRLIEQPNSHLIPYLRILCKILRQIKCPPYNYLGYEGQNAYKNALAHVGNFAFVTTDISHYYPNSKAKYVQEFFEKELFISDNKNLEFLMKILTFNGHIPTGAPTSPILAFLTHKKLFDKIYDKVQKQNILFTLYADDISLSAKHGITNDVIRFIQDVLAEHELCIKAEKTKHYSYKKALITGYYVHQNGKISVPDKIGHSVIQKLNKKAIEEMNETELRKLIGKINYINFVDKKAFRLIKIKAYNQLNILYNTK